MSHKSNPKHRKLPNPKKLSCALGRPTALNPNKTVVSWTTGSHRRLRCVADRTACDQPFLAVEDKHCLLLPAAHLLSYKQTKEHPPSTAEASGFPIDNIQQGSHRRPLRAAACTIRHTKEHPPSTAEASGFHSIISSKEATVDHSAQLTLPLGHTKEHPPSTAEASGFHSIISSKEATVDHSAQLTLPLDTQKSIRRRLLRPPVFIR